MVALGGNSAGGTGAPGGINIVGLGGEAVQVALPVTAAMA